MSNERGKNETRMIEKEDEGEMRLRSNRTLTVPLSFFDGHKYHRRIILLNQIVVSQPSQRILDSSSGF